MEEPLNEAEEIVKKEIKMSSCNSGSYRTPPLIISRLSRGGKTTFIRLLFDRLKILGFNPVIINFNGTTGRFHLFEGESQNDAILRLIATQLIDTTNLNLKKVRLVCDPQALDAFIGMKPLVLMIDELNALAHPVDREAGSLLRDMFLDRKNRYVVATSHVPFPADFSELTIGLSNRDIRGIHLPISTNLSELRKMGDACMVLTGAEVMYYGAIPSLIYSVKQAGYKVRSKLKNIPMGIKDTNEDLSLVLAEILTGIQCASSNSMRFLDAFGSIDKDERISWPMCYIEVIFSWFHSNKNSVRVVELMKSFVSHSQELKTGKEWEKLVQIGLMLQLMNLHYRGFQHQVLYSFKIPSGEKPEVMVAQLLPEIDTIEIAYEFILSYVKNETSRSCLILFIPTNAQFALLDGFIVYRRENATISIKGFQSKTGNEYPKKDVPSK